MCSWSQQSRAVCCSGVEDLWREVRSPVHSKTHDLHLQPNAHAARVVWTAAASASHAPSSSPNSSSPSTCSSISTSAAPSPALPGIAPHSPVAFSVLLGPLLTIPASILSLSQSFGSSSRLGVPVSGQCVVAQRAVCGWLSEQWKVVGGAIACPVGGCV